MRSRWRRRHRLRNRFLLLLLLLLFLPLLVAVLFMYYRPRVLLHLAELPQKHQHQHHRHPLPLLHSLSLLSPISSHLLCIAFHFLFRLNKRVGVAMRKPKKDIISLRSRCKRRDECWFAAAYQMVSIAMNQIFKLLHSMQFVNSRQT